MTQLRNLLTVPLVIFGFVIVIACGAKTVDSQGQPKPTPAKLTTAD